MKVKDSALLQTITSGKKELLKNRQLFDAEIYASEYVKQANVDMSIYEVVIPAATTLSWQDTQNNLILVMLAGQLMINNQQSAMTDDVVVAPAGLKTELLIDGQQAVHAILMIRRADKLLKQPILRHLSTTPWVQDIENGHVHLYIKNLLTPEEIGGCVMYLDYPAGHVTEWHDHDFTHAAYITDGIFVNESQFDQGEKYYGPGSFVCGPKAQVMRHGAASEQECHCWFLTDQRFALNYLDEKTVEQAKKQAQPSKN